MKNCIECGAKTEAMLCGTCIIKHIDDGFEKFDIVSRISFLNQFYENVESFKPKKKNSILERVKEAIRWLKENGIEYERGKKYSEYNFKEVKK